MLMLMLMPRKALGGDFAVEFRSDAPHSAYSVASPTPRSDEAEIKLRMHLRKQTTFSTPYPILPHPWQIDTLTPGIYLSAIKDVIAIHVHTPLTACLA